jgi:ABC-type multidrug transport system permease subunit
MVTLLEESLLQGIYLEKRNKYSNFFWGASSFNQLKDDAPFWFMPMAIQSQNHD